MQQKCSSAQAPPVMRLLELLSHRLCPIVFIVLNPASKGSGPGLGHRIAIQEPEFRGITYL